MSTFETLVSAALAVLERDGESQFSTRAVCTLANVTAPTLYHHFENADALLSAAIVRAFEQFLASKRTAVSAPDPVVALAAGWDHYVRFAAERPKLYAAMMARVLSGAQIPAAQQAQALLVDRLRAVEAVGQLTATVEIAAQVAWASANGAALLCATSPVVPSSEVLTDLRDAALAMICQAATQEGL